MTISNEAYREAIKRANPTAFPWLAVIEHRLLAGPLRLTTEVGGMTSQGEAYTFFPFVPVFPADTDAMPKARIEFANVDRTIGDAIMSLIDPAEITLKIVTALDFDKVEKEAKNLLLVNVEANAVSIRGELIFRNYDVEPYPGVTASEERLPALWR